MLAREIAALTAVMPSWVAGTVESEPWNLPMGVRAADRITTSYTQRVRQTFDRGCGGWGSVGVTCGIDEDVAYDLRRGFLEWERVRAAILCIFVEERQSLNVEGGASFAGDSGDDVPKTGKFAFS